MLFPYKFSLKKEKSECANPAQRKHAHFAHIWLLMLVVSSQEIEKN
jgi:hypothetical protein